MIFKNKIKDISVFIILIALLVIGSFKDFQISNNFYAKNAWINQFFAIIAKIPLYAIATIACVSLFKIALKKEKMAHKIILCFIYALGGILCGYLMCEDLIEVFLDGILKLVISGLLGALVFVCVFFLDNIKIEEHENCKKEYLIIIISVALIVLISFNLKEIVDRTRFNEVLLKHGKFTNWYKKGTGGDSFPSGHTISAMGLIAVIPYLKKIKNENKAFIFMQNNDYIFYAIFFMYTLFVAMTRINSGMHYLTDVSMGALIGFLVSKIATWCVLGINEDNFNIKEKGLINLL